MKLLDFLQQPYPFEDYKERSHLKKLLNGIGQGTFIALFLIIFEPFGIAYFNSPDKTTYLIGFGVVTALCNVFLNFAIVPLFPSYYNSDKWTVGREILFISILIMLIAIGNSVYLNIFLGQKMTISAFIFNVSSVVLVGIFPVGFGVMVNYIIQLRKYQNPIEIRPHDDKVNTITLIAENDKDTISLAQNQLLFIESADNYAVIYFVDDNKVKKDMLRSSLSRLEKQVEGSSMVRCHRSFIVNLDKVIEVTGNAQGYKLHLEETEEIVPVARKYSEIVKRLKA